MNNPIKSNLSSIAAAFLILFTLGACSDEDRDSLSKISDMADKLEQMDDLEESLFDQNCIENLSQLIDDSDLEFISPQQQIQSVTALNQCVDAIEEELDLTEKEFDSRKDDSLCSKGVKEIRGYLPKLITSIQELAAMPNGTQEEQMTVGMSLAFVSADVIAKGSMAVLNRTVSCTLGLTESMLSD